MELLYSNIPPLTTKKGQKTIYECIHEQVEKSDHVEVAVGYVSSASLCELQELVKKFAIKSICLNIGMYYLEGMPERSYHDALKINKKWCEENIGEIRLIKPFKYHGKIYCFYKNGRPFSAIVGSANLGVIKPEASNRNQYEVAILIDDEKNLIKITNHISELKSDKYSSNIAYLSNIKLVREKNIALDGNELVKPVPPNNVSYYDSIPSNVSFYLKLKVPKYNERFLDDGKHYTKSNINVCYAAPRSKRKARDWYETQITVSSKIYKMDGYPKRNVPFFVITDDGYWFKAHTTSANNKQFSAVGDELTMGRWLKGRLAAAGIATPINNIAEDKQRNGMITQEMLEEYGCDSLLFKKTGKTAIDAEGNNLDVWMLSFTSHQKDE